MAPSTSTIKDLDKDMMVDSRRSSITSTLQMHAGLAYEPINSKSTSSSRTNSTSNISRTSTSTNSSSSTTKSKRQRVKGFFKRMGNGALHSLAYYNAIEYSPAAIQYYESKKYDGRTPDEVLNDIYGVHCHGMYW